MVTVASRSTSGSTNPSSGIRLRVVCRTVTVTESADTAVLVLIGRIAVADRAAASAAADGAADTAAARAPSRAANSIASWSRTTTVTWTTPNTSITTSGSAIANSTAAWP